MKVIPAIDIRFGKCIRLYQGDFNQSTEYNLNPLEVAMLYAAQGATEIHIVDLDGAKNEMLSKSRIIDEISSKLCLPIQIGGGIRTTEQILDLFAQGASRVVIGSLAVTNQKLVKSWLDQFGPEKIVLALDVNVNTAMKPLLTTSGWQQQTNLTMWELLENYLGSDLKYVLCTDISRDGTLSSPNFSLYDECQKRFPNIFWQASGGVATLQDLILLNNMKIHGAIVGKALYEKKFTITEAMQVVKSC